MRIRGQELDINYEEELDGIDFVHSKIRENKLQACSPFREDSHPSFAINLENGLWIDSGADEDRFKKGNIVSFLALIRDTPYEEIEDYLLEKYAINFEDTSKLELKINLDHKVKTEKPIIDFTAEYKYSRYLDKFRGINVEVQELFNTFETEIKGQKVIGMGWYDKSGRLINIKYRCIHSKHFFYEENGEPIKPHLFGLHRIMQVNPSEIWIVESEIDAMYLWSCGIYAVALGRASVNDSQLKLLKNTGASSIVIATDNDPVGRLVKDVLAEELLPYFKVQELVFPNGIKDVNELEEEYLRYTKFNLKLITVSCNI